MDAVKFVKERDRMCNFYHHAGDCHMCPAKDVECNSLCDMVDDDNIVSIVEQWASAHPRKTRQDVFLEQWPEAYIEPTTDALFIKPCHIEKSMDGSQECCISHCNDCRREFWGKEVE